MRSVLVLDDHPIVLQACRRVLEDAVLTSVRSSCNVAAAFDLVVDHAPDVVIVDPAFSDNELDGLTLIRRISAHSPNTCILVLSMHDSPAIVAQSLAAGASGYLLKDAPADELIEAVQRRATDPPFLSAGLVSKIATARANARGLTIGAAIAQAEGPGIFCDTSDIEESAARVRLTELALPRLGRDHQAEHIT